MIKLDVTLFDTLQWKWVDFEVIAESEEKALEVIDKEYPREYRRKPYSGGEDTDSLSIQYREELEYFIIS